jgi:hypothetical protein
LKAYLITTGAVFGLITGAHIWRAVVEPHVAKEPWFIFLTVITFALCLWAFSLLRRL